MRMVYYHKMYENNIQSPVFKRHLFLVLSLNISYQFNLF
jgi:hypothetical protein